MICPNVRGVSEAFSNLAPRIWLGVGVLIVPPAMPDHGQAVILKPYRVPDDSWPALRQMFPILFLHEMRRRNRTRTKDGLSQH